MTVLYIAIGALIASAIYWPMYRRVERDRLIDATMARYARRYGR